MSYKDEQQSARDAWKKARKGVKVVCILCGKSSEGGTLIRVEKNKYKHEICK